MIDAHFLPDIRCFLIFCPNFPSFFFAKKKVLGKKMQTKKDDDTQFGNNVLAHKFSFGNMIPSNDVRLQLPPKTRRSKNRKNSVKDPEPLTEKQKKCAQYCIVITLFYVSFGQSGSLHYSPYKEFSPYCCLNRC